MEILLTIEKSLKAVQEVRQRGTICGLVPTMGALHEGHMSLVRAAKERCGWVIVTIFVNPMQFGPNEDFTAYPRTLEDDLAKCREGGVDAVFTPSVEVMYGSGNLITVRVARLTDRLCGLHRPGHFDGVATVVAKLFHIAPAHAAFFGEKDYQQLMVIRRMVADLDFDIEVVGCPTLREPDGLAMSSRNIYLSSDQRQQALSISRALFDAQTAVQQGQRSALELSTSARQTLTEAGIKSIDYVDIVDTETLEPLVEIDRVARLCIAARVGKTRLIDNVALEPSRTT